MPAKYTRSPISVRRVGAKRAASPAAAPSPPADETQPIRYAAAMTAPILTAGGPAASIQGHNVGETKTVNGVTYRLNENHRWVRDQDNDGQADATQSFSGGDQPGTPDSPGLAETLPADELGDAAGGQPAGAAGATAGQQPGQQERWRGSPEDHAKRHSFVTSQMASVQGPARGVILAMHEAPEYKQGGEYATKDFAPEQAAGLQQWMQANIGQQVGGGQVVNLGGGRLGFSSPAGAVVVWPADESGKLKVGYTNNTGVVNQAMGAGGDGAVAGTVAGEPQAPPLTRVDRPGQPESSGEVISISDSTDTGGTAVAPADDPDAPLEMPPDETPAAAADETSADQPTLDDDAEGEPAGAPQPAKRKQPPHVELRQRADQSRSRFDAATKQWQAAVESGKLSGTGNARWKAYVGTLRTLWRDHESLARDAERKESTAAKERGKAEREAMRAKGIDTKRRVTGQELREGEVRRAERDAERRKSNRGDAVRDDAPLLDVAESGQPGGYQPATPEALARKKELMGLPKRQQKLHELADKYLGRFNVQASDENRAAISEAIRKGRVKTPRDLRTVLRTAKRLHERGNLADSDHPHVKEAIRRKSNRESRESWQATVKKQAEAWDMKPHDYEALATTLHRDFIEHHREREAAKLAAQKATGLTAKGINRLENEGFDSGSSHEKIKDLDAVGRDLASQYPGLGWGRGREDDSDESDIDYGEKLWALLREGRRNLPSKASPEFTQHVDDFLQSQLSSALSRRGGSGGPGGGDDDLSAVPFAKVRDGQVRRYKLPTPTDAQREAGNYKKKHVRLHGLEVSIENEKGSRRRPEWPVLKCDYGYIRRTEGRDGDHIDVFVGPDADAELVFVVDQVTEGGRFDEHKCMIGWTNRKAAIEAYLSNYQAGWKLGDVTAMTIDQFKEWLENGDTMNPVAGQVSRYSRPQAAAKA